MISKRIIFLVIATTILLSFIGVYEKPEEAPLQYNKRKFEPPKLPLYNVQTKQGILLGRLLFYDAILSGNNKQACADCHQQELSFTDGKPLSIGSKGDTIQKNSMTLVHLAWGKDFFWDGRIKSIEDLVKEPITNIEEMAQDEEALIAELKAHQYYPKLFAKAFPDEPLNMKTISKAIAQFLRTIITKGPGLPDSLQPASFIVYADTVKAEDELKEENFRGTYLRLGKMCTPCHTSEALGGELMANNMIDKNQKSLFKVPSLINVLTTAPYMHDGRFKTPKEVLKHYDKHIVKLHEVNKHLDLEPIPNLFTRFDITHFDEFLQLFIDSNIIKNGAFSNPFKAKDFSWEALVKE
jgi:cytochrome c peroxidase